MDTVVLSGLRPTGRLHLGNYVGAIKSWKSLQDEGRKCIFMIADLHALTTEYQNTSSLREDILEMVKDILACGIEPQRSLIFRQSDVPYHAQLHLLLSNITPLGWLTRCPTYKEQVKELGKKLLNFGFLGYPVLQAADILLYKAEIVPVGKDQLPHLEITREIARRFNTLYKPIFPMPQPYLSDAPKLLGTDGKKMSKSYNNCIYLCEDEESLKEKVQSMVTDPARIHRGDKGHPQICSVFSLHHIFLPDPKEIEEACKDGRIGCVECKKRLHLTLSQILSPIKERRERLSEKEVYSILHKGAEGAQEIAAQTYAQAKEAMGL